MHPLIPILIVLGISAYLYFMKRSHIPKHLWNHPLVTEENLLSEDLRLDLMNLIKNMGTFSSNVDQGKVTGFKPVYEQVGEGIPIGQNGTCAHPLLFPNSDRTMCIFPERIDIGQHFVMTGGMESKKENIRDLVARVSSFGRFTFIKDLDNYPKLKDLFESESFQSAAKKVCPKDKTYLDPFQFNFILQVPGQSVALHLDAPYFWGATRFHFPQWLLAVMAFSNLFQEKFINQVQVVGYLHEWSTMKENTGGEFVYYEDDEKIGYVKPLSRAGTIVDGSKVVHAAQIYHPDVKAPLLDKDKDCYLKYVADRDAWDAQCDDKVIATYPTSDLRITLVYRARCFADAEEASRFDPKSTSDMMTLDSVLDTFKADLIAHHGKTAAQLQAMHALDFGLLLMKTYIRYPLPPKEASLLPYNYCALPLIAKWTAPLVAYFCA